LRGGTIKGKKALIVAELVDESFAHANAAIMEELFQWFREAVAMPGVKEIKRVVESF
jgi:hypothetical protein